MIIAWKLFFIRVYEFYIHFRRALDWWVFGGVVNLAASFLIALLFLLIVLKPWYKRLIGTLVGLIKKKEKKLEPQQALLVSAI